MLYLLHSTTPLGNGGRNGASHYLGWTEPEHLARRLKKHRSGRGAAITRAYVRAGAKLLLTLTIAGGTRLMERRLKSNGHLAAMCPLCSPYLGVIGRAVSLTQLSRATKHSKPLSAERSTGRGGGSRPGSPTGKSTSSPAGPRQVRATVSPGGKGPGTTIPGGGA